MQLEECRTCGQFHTSKLCVGTSVVSQQSTPQTTLLDIHFSASPAVQRSTRGVDVRSKRHVIGVEEQAISKLTALFPELNCKLLGIAIFVGLVVTAPTFVREIGGYTNIGLLLNGTLMLKGGSR